MRAAVAAIVVVAVATVAVVLLLLLLLLNRFPLVQSQRDKCNQSRAKQRGRWRKKDSEIEKGGEREEQGREREGKEVECYECSLSFPQRKWIHTVKVRRCHKLQLVILYPAQYTLYSAILLGWHVDSRQTTTN